MIIEQISFWERANKKDVDAIVCTTNNVIKSNGSLVMGRGIAAQFKETFKGIDYRWGKLVEGYQEGGHNDYGIILDGPNKYNHNSIYLIGLQTKREWFDPSPIDLVEFSCRKLFDLANLLCWSSIIMTKPGCGNGGLDWKVVEKKIKFLDDRFTIVELGCNE